MPPSNTQPTQQPNPSPVNDTSVVSKKIRNAGQSVLLLGSLLVFLGGVASLGIGSIASDERTRVAISLVVLILVSIYWIIAGLQIKKNQNNPTKALSVIKTVLITGVALIIWRVIAVVMGGGLGVGDFAIVLVIYLLVAQSRIKQLAKPSN